MHYSRNVKMIKSINVFSIILLIFLTFFINKSFFHKSDEKVICYVTDTGSKYHSNGCQYLYGSKNKITLADAKRLGYTDCSRCNVATNSYEAAFIITIIIVGLPFLYLRLRLYSNDDKKYNEEQELIWKVERDKYFHLYNGKTNLELAETPKNIMMNDENLPILGVGGKYGSYSVYISDSGKHYHSLYSCCNARIEIHLFNALNMRYSSCSKCCSYDMEKHIPDWYVKYLDILKIKEKYNLE